MPTTAITASAVFAAAIASGDDAGLRFVPDQLGMRLAVLRAIGDADRRFAALLQVNAAHTGGHLIARRRRPLPPACHLR